MPLTSKVFYLEEEGLQPPLLPNHHPVNLYHSVEDPELAF
jgi:hypothetical protein